MCKIGPTGLNPIWLSGSNRRIWAGTNQIDKSPTKLRLVFVCVEACRNLDLVSTLNELQIIGKSQKRKKWNKEEQKINQFSVVLSVISLLRLFDEGKWLRVSDRNNYQRKDTAHGRD